ncbi:MAG: hypothetical protein WBE68_27175 [Candidatus Nitrosopolaris sp.]
MKLDLTVADSIGNTFQPKYFPQQAPPQYSIHRSLPTIDDQRYGTGLSQESTQKIDELKRLVQISSIPKGVDHLTYWIRLFRLQSMRIREATWTCSTAGAGD